MASPPTRTARSVFIDSSVLFAAAYSVTGYAHDLVEEAFQGRVSLMLSEYVLTETERNLLENAPRAYPSFLRLRDALPYKLSHPSKRLVTQVATVVVAKDAPIIAAARAARISLVATYDRRDLLSKRAMIHDAFGITVATPEEILTLLGLR